MLENYKRASELYRELYKKNYNNHRNKYRYGVCLVYTHDIKNALSLLENVKSIVTTPPEVLFHIGKAYHLSNNFNEATKYYNKYLATIPSDPALLKRAIRSVEMCNNAKTLMKDSLKVEFVNMGKYINTQYDEYIPFISPKEDLLTYSTRRLGTTGRVYDLESYYTADIYAVKYKYGAWGKAKSIGAPNSYGNEHVAGGSENGKFLLYYVNNPESKNNLQLAKKGKSSFTRSVKIDSKYINLNSSEQESATISNDGKYLIFASKRKGGYGGLDLYICEQVADKKDSTKTKWGPAKNLGNTINTKYDDAYPYLINNGSYLIFASEGHNSMGGYDIFYTKFNIETLAAEKPKNMGYPINTTDDNYSISFNESKNHGYISRYDKNGEGNLDIYKVILNEKFPFQ
jgi:tetratricopeptide (TPR) repeat protein